MNQDKDNIIRKRRIISGQGEDNYRKDCQSDIDEANRQKEEYHKKVKIKDKRAGNNKKKKQKNQDKEKTIKTRRRQ